MAAAKTIVIATHRRSGTHWTIDALRGNSPDIAETFLTLERIAAHHDSPLPLDDFHRQLDAQEKRVLLKLHDLPCARYFNQGSERDAVRSLLRASPIIYVHRDGRDVMASLYHYMQSFSPIVARQSFGEFLRAESDLDGQLAGMSRPAFWAHHAHVWLGCDNLLPLSYAALENDYAGSLRMMADFLSLRLRRSPRAIDLPAPVAQPSLLERARRKLGMGRRQLSSAVQPRHGKSGDWRRHFSADDLDYFMEQAGEMMRRLGYLE